MAVKGIEAYEEFLRSIGMPTRLHELGGKEERDISRQDKLYLYFSQCGRCMYSGKPIELSDLYNTVLCLYGDETAN